MTKFSPYSVGNKHRTQRRIEMMKKNEKSSHCESDGKREGKT